MKPSKNYIDEKGNYHNIENLTLTQIYDSGVEEGYRIAKQEGERIIAQVKIEDAQLTKMIDELAERIKKGEFLLYDSISGDDSIESENKEE